MFSKVVALSTLAVAASTTLYSEDHTQLKTLWEDFKTKFAKKYDTMEDETRRFYLFVENLKTADLRNLKEQKAGGSAVFGVTKFSDLSQAEFESQFLTADVSKKTSVEKVTIDTPPSATRGLVDWTGKYTTDVKNQGYCGSCWAFSATEQIESDAMRTLGKSWVLAPQQITSCDNAAYGCGGGWTEVAYGYVKTAGGLELESNYPYTSGTFGITGICKEDSSKFVVTVDSYTTLNGESSMASYVQSTGPLSVCLDANNWNSYKSGIMTSCGKQVDHCVQAVGVDASSGGYWKVRNSWGEDWGEDGHIRLAYGSNTCDITNDPTYVKVSAV